MSSIRPDQRLPEGGNSIQQEEIPPLQEQSRSQTISELFCCCFSSQEPGERQGLLSRRNVTRSPIISQPSQQSDLVGHEPSTPGISERNLGEPSTSKENVKKPSLRENQGVDPFSITTPLISQTEDEKLDRILDAFFTNPKGQQSSKLLAEEVLRDRFVDSSTILNQKNFDSLGQRLSSIHGVHRPESKPTFNRGKLTRAAENAPSLIKMKDAVLIGKNIFNEFSVYMREIENHLQNDAAEIEKTFGIIGKVESICLSGKETHDRGKCVAFVHFEDGSVLVYKPRSISLDSTLSGSSSQSLFSTFNRLMNRDVVGCVKYLDKNDHGYAEYIHDGVNARLKLTSEQLQDFFYNWGAFFALSNIFMIDDLHYENVICIGNVFYFIDVEVVGDLRRLTCKPEEEITSNLLISAFSNVVSPSFISLKEGELVSSSDLIKKFSEGYKVGEQTVAGNQDEFLGFIDSIFKKEIRSVIVETMILNSARNSENFDNYCKKILNEFSVTIENAKKNQEEAVLKSAPNLDLHKKALKKAYDSWDIPKYTIKEENGSLIVASEGEKIQTLMNQSLADVVRGRVVKPLFLDADEKRIGSIIASHIGNIYQKS